MTGNGVRGGEGGQATGLPRGWEGEYRRQPGGGAHQTRFEYVKAGEAER